MISPIVLALPIYLLAREAGVLDDYAFLTHGLLNLHEATGEQRWLDEAPSDLIDARRSQAEIIEKAGFTVDDASSGEEALQAIHTKKAPVTAVEWSSTVCAARTASSAAGRATTTGRCVSEWPSCWATTPTWKTCGGPPA